MPKNNISKVASSCIFCTGEQKEPVCSVKEHEYPDTTEDEFHFVCCTGCGLIFLDPRPDDSELGVIYPSNYFAFDLAETSSGSRGLTVGRISKAFEKRRISALLTLHSEAPIERVLDVGCGDGSDLELVESTLGEGLLSVGVEVAPLAARKAQERGHQIVVGSFPEVIDDVRAKSESYDLIISKHVIEHVSSPEAFLGAIRSLVAQDGLVIIDTPNTDSPLRTLFGKHWGGWHTPRHWFLFDPPTFEKLAHRCGFQQVEVIQMPINTFWVWGLHSVLFDRWPKLADRLFNPSESGKGGLLGIGLLSVFQIFELSLKLLFGRTSQMRIILKPRKLVNL